MSIAVYPGSFDPITNGHLDILDRALGIFKEVIVLVASNSGKSPLFSLEERVSLIEEVIQQNLKADIKANKRVRVERLSGLMVDYARQVGARAVIRGMRAASDFEYEFMMASMNRELNPEIETVFMMTSKNLYFVSSTMIKELSQYGGDVSPYVPSAVVKRLKMGGGKRS